MIALFWNARGVNKKGFSNSIRTFKNLYKLNFLAILEPRVSGPKAQKISTSFGFTNFYREEAKGFAGGLWIFWDESEINIQILQSSHQAITVLATKAMKTWVMTIVYASPTPYNRKELWNYLNQVAGIINHPWILAGDFNEIIAQNEKIGGSENFTSSGFANWIQDNSMIDLGFQGQSYTLGQK